MNFEYSPEQLALRDSLTRFLAQNYSFDQREAMRRSGQDFDDRTWQKMAELGVLAILFAEEEGGLGGTASDMVAIFEVLGRALVREPLAASLVVAAALRPVRTQSETAREVFDRIVDGSSLTVLAHGEPRSRFEHSRVETRAHRVGDAWVIDGAKAVVRHAESARHFLVTARTSGNVDDASGISLFLVPADIDGLDVQAYEMTDGGRGGDLRLREVRLSSDGLLSKEGDAFDAVERAIAAGVLAQCAQALGAMEVTQQLTLDYLRTRKQFGVPISSHQALQHRMVDAWLGVEQSRSALLNAAHALNGDRIERERAISAAKITFSQAAIRMAEECIQMHGGIGMTWELPAAHYAKSLVMTDQLLGDEDYHLARYIMLDSAAAVSEGN